MIQRKQTVYLFLSAILCLTCASLPVGSFEANTMGITSEMYNLCIIDGNTHEWNYTVCGLFVLLMVSATTSVLNIFKYNNRKVQSRNCLINSILLLLWYGLYAVVSSTLCAEDAHFSIQWSAALPFVAIVLQFLARHGIIADEKLIRSMDRIR